MTNAATLIDRNYTLTAEPTADVSNTRSEAYWTWERHRRFESEYKKLGWTRGRYASTRERDKARAFWVYSGKDGAKWLVRHVRDEPHVDVLDHVANLLADIGPACLSPILEELSQSPTVEQADALLTAVGWLRESRDPRLSPALAHLSRHSNADVREACVLATRALGQSEALQLLRTWHEIETHAEVKDALEAEIANRTN